MKDRSETILLVLFVFLLIGGIVGLYANLSQNRGAGQLLQAGKIESLSGNIQRKNITLNMWQRVKKSDPVFFGDFISSDNQAECILSLSDNIKVYLGEKSAIYIEPKQKENETSISVKKGLVHAFNSSERRTIKMEIAQNKIHLIKGEINLIGDDKSGFLVNSISGKTVVLDSKNHAVDLQSGSLLTNQQGIDARKDDIKILTPVFRNKYLTNSKFEEVLLKWEGFLLEPNSSFLIEVSSSYNFMKIEKSFNTRKNYLNLSLPLGKYFWRVSVKNVPKKVLRSSIGFFSVEAKPDLRVLTPVANQKFHISSKIQGINIIFTEINEVLNYKVKICRDPGCQNVVVEEFTSTPSYFFEIPQSIRETQREFFLQVFSGKSVFQQTEFKSPQIKFYLEKKGGLEHPLPVFPRMNQKINRQAILSRGILFAWQDQADEVLYTLKLAQDPGFRKKLFEATTSQNSLEVKLSAYPNTVYWQVANADVESRILPQVNKFNLEEQNLLTVNPKNNLAMEYYSGQTNGVSFLWQSLGLPGTYQLEISRQSNFSTIDFSLAQKGISKNMKGLKPGIYFWRVKFLTQDSLLLTTSEVRTFQVSEPLLETKFLSPQPEKRINLTDKNSLDLQWQAINGANTYRLQLFLTEFDNKSNRKKLVYSGVIKQPFFSFSQFELLNEGRISAAIEPLNMSHTGEILRRAKPTAIDFEVFLAKTNSDQEIKIEFIR